MQAGIACNFADTSMRYAQQGTQAISEFNVWISHQWMALQRHGSSFSPPALPRLVASFIATPGLYRLGVGCLLALGYVLEAYMDPYLGR